MHRSTTGPALTLLLALTVAMTGLAAGCTSASDPPSAGSSSPTPRHHDALSVQLAGGRTLAARCSGKGAPVVVFLHGLIQPADSASWAHAPELRTRLDPHMRYCEYERANVGSSSKIEGPVPMEQTVADLDAVIDAVSADEPVILVGGSFGGQVAYTYTGLHPDRVAGVVLLDPTLPDEPGLERAFLTEDLWLPTDAWQQSKEKIDVYGAYATAQAALPATPAVPGTLFATAELWAPDGPNAEPFRQGVRQQQADLMTHYTPGTIVTVEAPHAMVSVVPDRIADAVVAIVDKRP